jgi:hypothetical protein
MTTFPIDTGDGGKARFLEHSPYPADNGELVGLDPRKIGASDLRDLGHPESYPKIIRAKCLDCAGGQPSEVRKCVCVDCPLWPARMGVNPFHRKGGGA